MKWFCTALALLAISVNSAAASTNVICGLLDVPIRLHGVENRYAHELTRFSWAGSPECEIFLEGAEFVVCSWELPYRSGRAGDVAVRMEKLAAHCGGPDITVKTDTAVNHPDTYSAKTFVLKNVNVAISVKDKAARDSTFVFFRVILP